MEQVASQYLVSNAECSKQIKRLVYFHMTILENDTISILLQLQYPNFGDLSGLCHCKQPVRLTQWINLMISRSRQQILYVFKLMVSIPKDTKHLREIFMPNMS